MLYFKGHDDKCHVKRHILFNREIKQKIETSNIENVNTQIIPLKFISKKRIII